MAINVVQTSDNLGITSVGIYYTDRDPDFTTFNVSSNIDVGVITCTQIRPEGGSFGSSGQILSSDGSKIAWTNPSMTSVGAAISFGIADTQTTNQNFYVVFVSETTGNAIGRIDTQSLTYNPSTNRLNDVKGDLRSIPRRIPAIGSTVVASSFAGEFLSVTGIVTFSSATAFSPGDAVTIYNNSASNITISAGTGVTVRLAGTSSTGTRTLAQRGVCSFICVETDVYVGSGGGLT